MHPLNTEMTTAHKNAHFGNQLRFLLANVIGMAFYLFYEHLLLFRGQDDDLNPIVAVSYWMRVDGPVLLGFVILNLIWAVLIINKARAYGNWRLLAWWGTAVLAWIVTLFVFGMAIGFLRLEM